MIINIRLAEPMSSRPCHYGLALQDDSVFADFNIDQNGCLYLVRISFDGYGCCRIASAYGIGRIESERSNYLIQQIQTDYSTNYEANKILMEYFNANKKWLWEDALKNHGLIQTG
jgi:hypothetical protein